MSFLATVLDQSHTATSILESNSTSNLYSWPDRSEIVLTSPSFSIISVCVFSKKNSFTVGTDIDQIRDLCGLWAMSDAVLLDEIFNITDVDASKYERGTSVQKPV